MSRRRAIEFSSRGLCLGRSLGPAEERGHFGMTSRLIDIRTHHALALVRVNKKFVLFDKVSGL